MRNSTILQMNVTFQEDKSVFIQILSTPLIGMFIYKKKPKNRHNEDSSFWPGNCIAIILVLISLRHKRMLTFIFSIVSSIVLFSMLLIFSIRGPTSYTPTQGKENDSCFFLSSTIQIISLFSRSYFVRTIAVLSVCSCTCGGYSVHWDGSKSVFSIKNG